MNSSCQRALPAGEVVVRVMSSQETETSLSRCLIQACTCRQWQWLTSLRISVSSWKQWCPPSCANLMSFGMWAHTVLLGRGARLLEELIDAGMAHTSRLMSSAPVRLVPCIDRIPMPQPVKPGPVLMRFWACSVRLPALSLLHGQSQNPHGLMQGCGI